MKLRVITLNGSVFELPTPDDFVFGDWVTSLKILNGWHMDRVFVPYHSIACCQWLADEASPISSLQLTPQGMTKQ